MEVHSWPLVNPFIYYPLARYAFDENMYRRNPPPFPPKPYIAYPKPSFPPSVKDLSFSREDPSKIPPSCYSPENVPVDCRHPALQPLRRENDGYYPISALHRRMPVEEIEPMSQRSSPPSPFLSPEDIAGNQPLDCRISTTVDKRKSPDIYQRRESFSFRGIAANFEE